MKRPPVVLDSDSNVLVIDAGKEATVASEVHADGAEESQFRVADDGYAYTWTDFKAFYPEWASWAWERASPIELSVNPPEGLRLSCVDDEIVQNALKELLPHLSAGDGEFEVGWSYRKGEYDTGATGSTTTTEVAPLESFPFLQAIMRQSMRLLHPHKEFGDRLNVICRQYEPNHAIVMHTDKKDWFGEDVFGVILENCSDCVLQLHGQATQSETSQCYFLDEKPGACFWMRGPARFNWMHGVAPLTSGRRISVTWRWFLPEIKLRPLCV